MVLRKVIELGSGGSLMITIPKKFVEELNIKAGDHLNFTKVGESLHATKVQIVE